MLVFGSVNEKTHVLNQTSLGYSKSWHEICRCSRGVSFQIVFPKNLCWNMSVETPRLMFSCNFSMPMAAAVTWIALEIKLGSLLRWGNLLMFFPQAVHVWCRIGLCTVHNLQVWTRWFSMALCCSKWLWWWLVPSGSCIDPHGFVHARPVRDSDVHWNSMIVLGIYVLDI